MALESSEDAIEAALFDLVPARQTLDHLPVGVRIFQVHVERGRISDAGPNKTSLAAPEFHAALEVRVKNPHAILSPKGPGRSQLSPEAILLQAQTDKDEARKEDESDGCLSSPLDFPE